MSPSKTYTDDDIERIREQAVLTAEVGELKSTVPEVFASLKSLNKAIAEIPIKIMECRDDMDREIKQYMHGKFLTEGDLNALERKLEDRVSQEVTAVKTKIDKVDRNVSKATWIVSGFLTACTFVIWLMKFTDIFQHVK